jgi:glycosyltransferase involved in cell wall biosynthesis
LRNPCFRREWLFVDDGSTDDTRSIIESYAAEHPWIRVISRENRGFRQLGSGVIAAFNFGREKLLSQDYQYIAKLDGDMSFPPRYLEIMLDKLDREPALAAVSGKVFRPENGRLVEEFMIDEMVAGQFKLYKRSAFDDIGGFTQTILWDGIDIHRCRMKGYTTISFHDSRRTAHPPPAHGLVRLERLQGSRAAGSRHLVHGLPPAVCTCFRVFRMHERPYVIGGLIIFSSYVYAALRREPKFDDSQFIDELRRWQLQKLRMLPKKLMASRRAQPDGKSYR